MTKLLGATVLVLLSGWSVTRPATADAAAATVRITTYLHAGPGAAYRPVDELTAGSDVIIDRCDAGWCHVVSGTVAGFVDAAVIAPGGGIDMIGPPLACFEARLPGYYAGSQGRYCIWRPANATGSGAEASP